MGRVRRLPAGQVSATARVTLAGSLLVGETSEVRTPLLSRISRNIHASNCFLLPAAQAVVLNEAGQISQGDGRQQGSSSLIYPRIGFPMRGEEIGRGPREGYDAAESQPY